MPLPRRLTAVGVVLLIGCTRVSDRQRFEPNADQIAILDTVPEAGASGVPTSVQIDLCWSNLVDPRSVGDIDALITSGNSLVDTRVAVQLLPWRPAANVEAPMPTEAPWCSGSVLSVTPKAELLAGVQYRLRLEDNAVGWAGEGIDTDRSGWIDDADGGRLFFLEFTVEDDPQPGPPEEEPEPEAVTLTDLFDTGGPFDPERAVCSCHIGEQDAVASARLDLTSPDAAFADLVIPTELRDTGFPMVTPRRPSDSFLLHKLLRDDDDTAIFGVLGAAMPSGEPPIEYADYVEIAAWIEAGALP